MQHRKLFVISSLCYASLFCLILVGTGKAQSIFATDGNSAFGLSGSRVSFEGSTTYGSDFGFSFLRNKADFGFTISNTGGRSGGSVGGMYLTIWGIKSEVNGNAVFAGINGGAGIAGSSELYWSAGLSFAARLRLKRKIHIVFPLRYDHIQILQSFGSSANVATAGVFPIFTLGERVTLSPGFFVASIQDQTVTGGSLVFTFMSGVKSKKKKKSDWGWD